MKKIYGFAFASAAMMLASCSSDEPINNGNQIAEGNQYMALSILGGNGTRAIGGYDDNKLIDGEGDVSSVTVLLFDNNGNQTQAPQRLTPNFTASDETGIEKVSEAVIVVENGAEIPSQIMVICNEPEASANYTQIVKNNTLTDVQAIAKNFNYATKGAFVMSNAQTANGPVATPITDANIKTSESEAKASPVEVYVERVLARVDVTEQDGGVDVSNNKITMADGTEQTLTVKINGLGLSYIPTESNLIKNVGTQIFDWALDTHRYDWASTNLSWNSNTNYGNFDMMNWNEYDANGWNSIYVQENTSNAMTETKKTTMLLLAATLGVGEGDNFKSISLASLRGGYYTEENALGKLAEFLYNAGFKAEDGGSLDPSVLSWVSSADREDLGNRYTTYAVVAADTKLHGEKTVAEANEYLKSSMNQVKLWKDGATYYYIPVEHNVNEGVTYNGIVRNFIYDYEINTIKGLGTPVVYPGDDIIPEDPEPDNDYKIAAQVKTLKWKVVKKHGNFGK